MPATVPPALPNSNMLSMSHGTVNYLTHFLSMAFYNRFWIVSISMSGGRIFLTDVFFSVSVNLKMLRVPSTSPLLRNKNLFLVF